MLPSCHRPCALLRDLYPDGGEGTFVERRDRSSRLGRRRLLLVINAGHAKKISTWLLEHERLLDCRVEELQRRIHPLAIQGPRAQADLAETHGCQSRLDQKLLVQRTDCLQARGVKNTLDCAHGLYRKTASRFMSLDIATRTAHMVWNKVMAAGREFGVILAASARAQYAASSNQMAAVWPRNQRTNQRMGSMTDRYCKMEKAISSPRRLWGTCRNRGFKPGHW